MQIWRQYNKRTKRYEWRARFRYNNKTFRPIENTKEDLEELIADIRDQEKTERDNRKYNREKEVPSYVPTVAEIFDKVLPTIGKHHQRTLAKRVFETFLLLLPPSIKVNQLTQRHFQLYINLRKGQIGKQSKQPIKLQTIYKELYAATSALKDGKVDYESLEKWQVPELPKLPKGFKKTTQRERLVSDKELSAVVGELVKPPTGKQTHAHHFHRVRLAHTLEFGYWTGLRRKEIARLKFSQYDEEQQALLNVKRWKTTTVTKFFPLGKRAVEIINERRQAQGDSDYIFTPDGEPIESNYRTLKTVCRKLKINYGRFSPDGFVSHDLRHNFGTEILRESDIETARELLGHSNITQTGTYLHTSADRLREAVRKRDKIDYNAELEKIFEAVKKGELNQQEFNEQIKKLFKF
ncbi:MAG: site-specific integrase [Acidobacteria bacterium]|nr:site-specific integrase [Acidobacteriota bacterium]MCA1638028.1 site-specific integrase [Acidobacteriota bacterium]